MPDRAVVICPNCEGEKTVLLDRPPVVLDVPCPDCEGKGWQPQPRAIVALSEDRQWLVVLDAEDGETHDGPQRFWTIFELDVENGYLYEDNVVDTGQDAQAVLDAWLAGRVNEPTK